MYIYIHPTDRATSDKEDKERKETQNRRRGEVTDTREGGSRQPAFDLVAPPNPQSTADPNIFGFYYTYLGYPILTVRPRQRYWSTSAYYCYYTPLHLTGVY